MLGLALRRVRLGRVGRVTAHQLAEQLEQREAQRARRPCFAVRAQHLQLHGVAPSAHPRYTVAMPPAASAAGGAPPRGQPAALTQPGAGAPSAPHRPTLRESRRPHTSAAPPSSGPLAARATFHRFLGVARFPVFTLVTVSKPLILEGIGSIAILIHVRYPNNNQQVLRRD